MMLPVFARQLQAGDIVRHPNWDEHVVRAWGDANGIAVVVAEFPDLILHYPLDARLELVR